MRVLHLLQPFHPRMHYTTGAIPAWTRHSSSSSALNRRRVRARLLVALGLLVLASFPTSALAATASVEDGGSGTLFLTYQAGAGEANQVDVSSEGEITTIHDSGAVIAAEAGCLSVDAHTVTCTKADGAVLNLLDLADSLSVANSLGDFFVEGGTGADALSSCVLCGGTLEGEDGNDSLSGRRLVGGPGNDTLSGGPRSDFLDGGRGNDTFTAGGGNDQIIPRSGDDVIDAGAGDDDLLDYDVRGPVSVNLRTGVATGAGTVTFTGVESVFGSRRGDLLIGDEKANGFSGFEGPDVIRGGPGADFLNGGIESGALNQNGNDRLYGGPGIDVLAGLNDNDLLVGGFGSDRLFAGRGDDVVKGEEGNDVLVGGLGSDGLFAGPGDDLLRSRDRRGDRVRGQQGQDRARVDRALDSVRGVERLL
jgi:Ca2+-binding RTX toxin-like protein